MIKRLIFISGVILLALGLCGCSAGGKGIVSQNTPVEIDEESIEDTAPDTETPVSESERQNESASSADASDGQKDSDSSDEPSTNQTYEGIRLESVDAVNQNDYTAEHLEFDEEGDSFVILTDSEVRNLEFYYMSSDGITFNVERLHYRTDTLLPSQALIIKAYIPETISNLYMCYTNAEGQEVEHFVQANMRDGGFVLIEAEGVNK